MKKSILFSIIAVIILIAVFIYYPVWDQEWLSYAIIFICFAMLCFSGAKIMTANEPADYDSTEKQMDKLYTEDGIFSYTSEGFYFTTESESKKYIKYSDILEVNTFKIPFLHEQTHSGIELITSDEKYEFIDQYCKGIEKFTEQLSDNLPFHHNHESKMTNNHGLRKKEFIPKNNVNFLVVFSDHNDDHATAVCFPQHV